MPGTSLAVIFLANLAAALAHLAAADSADPVKVQFNVAGLTNAAGTGSFTVEIHPEWAPLGADRFSTLVKESFFDQTRFFRVLPNFMAQFGISGDPKTAAKWKSRNLKDDPSGTISNLRGRLTFATAGPGTRTTQIFINFKDNEFLDSQGFSPFAQVVEGMDVVDQLYDGYGEGAPDGNGPSQGEVEEEGNSYLTKDFPKLSYITSAKFITSSASPSAATPSSAAAAGPSNFYVMHKVMVLTCSSLLGVVSTVSIFRYVMEQRKQQREAHAV